MSKFPLEVLRRHVYPRTAGKHHDPAVILGSTFGEDVTPRGGVLETFLEIGCCSGVCMDIDASALPVPLVV
ncbi:MAG: hypothetical protein ACP5DY_02215 [Thermovirgaceae bacterium]